MLTAWLLNYGLVQLGQAPWVYCLGLKVAPLFAGYVQIVGLAVMVYFAWSVWRGGFLKAVWAGLVTFVVLGLPVFLTTLWGLGAEGRCG